MTVTKAPAVTAVSVGWSSFPEARQAGRQAAQTALAQLGAARVDLAILFASVRYDQGALLRGVGEVLGNVPLIGGSDAGEIAPGASLRRSVVLMLIASDHMRFTIGYAEHLRTASRAAGQSLAGLCMQSLQRDPRRAFLLLADGLTGANRELVRGVQERLGTSFPIVGALTGDDLLYRETYQYFRNRVLTDSAVGVLITGQARVGMRARHGWHAVGRPHVVTRANGNLLQQLDRAPAARVYAEYLGEDEVRLMQGRILSTATVAYPLGMTVEGEEELLLRNVIRVEQDGSLLCSGDVWEGTRIRLMMGTREGAVEAAGLAASQAREGCSRVDFALLFDSVARRKLFGREPLDELRAVQSGLGMTTPFIGCYTYGEHAPLRAVVHMGRSYFHNATALVVTVGA